MSKNNEFDNNKIIINSNNSIKDLHNKSKNSSVLISNTLEELKKYKEKLFYNNGFFIPNNRRQKREAIEKVKKRIQKKKEKENRK